MTIKKLPVFIILVFCAFFPTSVFSKEKAGKDVYKMLEEFSNIMVTIKNNYVDPITYDKLIQSAIHGMLKELDPHSDYLTGEDFKRMTESTSGKFAGVGMIIQKDPKTQYILVVSPIDDTPARKAGMQSGDLIVKIAGRSTDTLSPKQSADLLRGKPDTSVKIQVWREGRKPFDVTLTRAIIKVPSVKASIKGNDIGYLRISIFQEGTADELAKHIKKLNTQAKKSIRGYIIDLRDNPGGLLSEAVKVADTFLNQGEIVSIRGRKNSDTQRYNAKYGDYTHGKPIVVLVNRGSASASEIVSGALQDRKRALIVGEKTFGKGSVQTIQNIEKNTAIKFTTARYYTPSGHSIQKLGILPDIPIKWVKIEEEAGAAQYTEASLKGAIANDQMKGKKQVEIKKEKKESLNITDYILARGLNILDAIIFAQQNMKVLGK